MRRLGTKLALCALLCCIVGIDAWGQTLRIDRLKAQYLVAFTEFARWTEESKDEAATIGILGSKDLARELRAITHAKAQGRAVKVLKLADGETERLHRIDILFVGAGFEKQWQKIKDHCMKHDILLVGERRHFIENGGAIQFTLRQNRLRFNVSPENARKHRIELSSKLLELAVESR